MTLSSSASTSTSASAGSVRDQRCEVVVVGAGIAGLVAASTLAPSTDVVVLEAAKRAGGRVESVRRGDYWVNVGAQFAEGTGTLFEAMDRYQVERGSLAGKKAALALNGRMVTTDNPAWLVLRSRMPLAARIELARVGLRIRRAYKRVVANKNRAAARDFRDWLDKQPASYLLKGVKSAEVRALFSAWAGQWIGCDPEETAATQFVYSIGTALEKAAHVPNFSLPVGGNQAFTDALSADLGDRVRLGAEVQSITWTDDDVTVDYTDEEGPVKLTAKRAVVTVPADRVRAIMPELPDEQRAALGDIDYGQYVLAGIFTKEQGKQRWDDFYGISTPELSFQMVFNHAAAVRNGGPRKPGGALVCLAGGTRARELAKASDEEIREAFLRDLLGLFPELGNRIDHVVVKRQERVVPFWGPGERASVRTLRDPLGPIHFAGDYLLGVPSLTDAASSGERAAAEVLQRLA